MTLSVTYILVDRGSAIDNSPVMQSQVLDRMLVQQANGIPVGLVTTRDDPEMFEELVGARLDDAGIPYVAVPDGRTMATIYRVSRALRGFLETRPSRFLYARGITGALAVRLADLRGRQRMIYDHRGDYRAEAALRGVGGFQRGLVSRAIGRFIRGATHVNCVSSGGAELIRREYRRKQVEVIPSCIDVDRFMADARPVHETRVTLGVDPEDVLVTYSGGSTEYACIDETLAYWEALAAAPKVKFLILSHSPRPWNERPTVQRLAGRGLLQVRSVGRAEVPSYLAASDVGFMLRRPGRINAAASPVKFAEYLAAGLSVVTSPGLTDPATLVRDRDLGLVVPPPPDRDTVESVASFVETRRAFRQNLRARSEAAARDVLDWRCYLPDWRALLSGPGT